LLAKRQREAKVRPELSPGIVAATAIMYPRLAAVVAFFSPALVAVLLPGLGFLFTVGAVISWWETLVEAAFGETGILTVAGLVGASDIDPFVLNLAQGGAPACAPRRFAPLC
jgi:hypothetical protein